MEALGFFLILGLMALYALPSILAFMSNNKNKVGILLVNILLGWTFFGWVGALVWAVKK